MKRWKRLLGDIRVLGPDDEQFNRRVAELWRILITKDAEIEALRRALIERGLGLDKPDEIR